MKNTLKIFVFIFFFITILFTILEVTDLLFEYEYIKIIAEASLVMFCLTGSIFIILILREKSDYYDLQIEKYLKD